MEEKMSFQEPRISHSIMVMVIALAFHIKDPNGVGDALNIFLLPVPSPIVGSESDLLKSRWGAMLRNNTFTSFSYGDPHGKAEGSARNNLGNRLQENGGLDHLL